MLNAEKFKDELLEILSENRYIEVDKYDRKIRKCTGNNCPKCMFGITALGKGRDSCSIAAMLWLVSEYKEPVKLTRLEYEILKWLIDKDYKYIARDSGGGLYVYYEQPPKKDRIWGSALGDHFSICDFRDLFHFVKWEDSTPTSIQEVLENCEVVEDESK